MSFLIQQPPPGVVINWNIFVWELNAMFRDRKRVHTAQQAVLTLQMDNNHQVIGGYGRLGKHDCVQRLE